MAKLIVECSNCNKILYKQPRDKRNKNHFCNIKCKSEWQSNQKLSPSTKEKISDKVSGKNNPMYGKTHLEKTRKNISNKKKKLYRDFPEKKYECGNSRLSKEERFLIISKGHKKRSRESYIRILSNDAKEKIRESSKNRFTPEFKSKVRNKMEKEGRWISLKEKPDYIFYRDMSGWKEKMWDLINDENQLKLLKENKIFNPIRNPKGVVRDHRYSRFYGWNNGVFPEILRHPANCEIIKHSDNVRKSGGWKSDENSISLYELFEKIESYSGRWREQQKCLELIRKYKNGERYNKKDYLIKYYE